MKKNALKVIIFTMITGICLSINVYAEDCPPGTWDSGDGICRPKDAGTGVRGGLQKSDKSILLAYDNDCQNNCIREASNCMDHAKTQEALSRCNLELAFCTSRCD
jgi:hypothetical protein